MQETPPEMESSPLLSARTRFEHQYLGLEACSTFFWRRGVDDIPRGYMQDPTKLFPSRVVPRSFGAQGTVLEHRHHHPS